MITKFLQINRAFDKAPALIIDDKTISYIKLADDAERLASTWARLGIRMGDRIAFQLQNRFEIVLCYFACFHIGAIAMPINNRFKPIETIRLLMHGKPRVLISETLLFDPMIHTCPELNIEFIALVDQISTQPCFTKFSGWLTCEPMEGFPLLDDSAPATLLYTSGTMGEPKGTIHLRRHIAANCLNQKALFKYSSEDSALLFLSLCHTFGWLRETMPCLSAGAAIVMLREFSPEAAIDAMRRYPISLLFGLPTMYVKLLEEAENQGVLRDNHLRNCLISGDAVPLALHEHFFKWFGIHLTEEYASTETMMIASNPLGGDPRYGSVGKAIPGMKFKIVGVDFNELPNHQIGEVFVQGETVMEGYLDNPEADKKSFHDGWFRSGDLASCDSEGRLWFAGRLKNIIVHGGSNIAPQEVESAFYRHPDVLEAGIIGVPSAIYGMNLKAFIALKANAPLISEHELREFIRPFLADYKLPETIVFLPSLPKGSSGKIDRHALESF